jgi:predicted nucleic acid-binding protein
MNQAPTRFTPSDREFALIAYHGTVVDLFQLIYDLAMTEDPTYLLDASVLIPLVLTDHEHHAITSAWAASAPRIAVCPIVQGALVRTLIRLGETPRTVAAVLEGIAARPGVEFWPDDISYATADLRWVTGHRQVTDAYLVALARAHGGILVTLDQPLAKCHLAGHP